MGQNNYKKKKEDHDVSLSKNVWRILQVKCLSLQEEESESSSSLCQFSTWGFVVSFDCCVAAATLLFRLSP